jgi:hypothetical protein
VPHALAHTVCSFGDGNSRTATDADSGAAPLQQAALGHEQLQDSNRVFGLTPNPAVSHCGPSLTHSCWQAGCAHALALECALINAAGHHQGRHTLEAGRVTRDDGLQWHTGDMEPYTVWR